MTKKNARWELRELQGNYLGNYYLSIYLSIYQYLMCVFYFLVPQVPKNPIYSNDKYFYFCKILRKAKPEKIKGTWGTKIFIGTQASDFIAFTNFKVVPKLRELNPQFQGTNSFRW